MRPLGDQVRPNIRLQADWKAKCMRSIEDPAGDQLFWALTESLKNSHNAVYWAISTTLADRPCEECWRQHSLGAGVRPRGSVLPPPPRRPPDVWGPDHPGARL